MLSSAPLNARSMLNATESLNKPLEKPFCAFLKATIADDQRHVRFLNMLSMLEHMGSRKIMLSQMKGVLTQDILKHLAEEARHAFFFKREAEKLSGESINGYPENATLSASAARFYFERLDAGLTANMLSKDQREMRYLWVSFVVELRAIWVYRFYQEALSEADHPMSLKGVIAEEDRHLIDMASRLDEIGFNAAELLSAACALEKGLFEKLLGSLQQG